MKKIYSDKEINFETGKCEGTMDSKLSIITERLKAVTNPYTGNKRKLIFDIVKILDENKIKYNSFLDLFSGSAYVSIAMKMLDKKVYTNDLLASSYLNAIAYVCNKDTVLTDSDQSYLFSKRVL